MMTRTVLIVAMAGLVGTAFTAMADVPVDQGRMTGKIAQINSGSIILQGGGQVTVAYNDATIITVDGTVATAADLEVGMYVVAFARDGKPATEIMARTPE